MKTSRSKIATALLSAGIVCGLGAFATHEIAQAQEKGKGKAAPAKAAAKGGNVTPGGLANGNISGVVQGEKGPEAGVWVIAETKDTLTNFIKIVVTDDQGRFMLPELPTANYDVWVRGYGLVDSAKPTAKSGAENVTIKVTSAKTPQ